MHTQTNEGRIRGQTREPRGWNQQLQEASPERELRPDEHACCPRAPSRAKGGILELLWISHCRVLLCTPPLISEYRIVPLSPLYVHPCFTLNMASGSQITLVHRSSDKGEAAAAGSQQLLESDFSDDIPDAKTEPNAMKRWGLSSLPGGGVSAFYKWEGYEYHWEPGTDCGRLLPLLLRYIVIDI